MSIPLDLLKYMEIYLKADIDKKKFQMALLHLETLNVSKNGNS